MPREIDIGGALVPGLLIWFPPAVALLLLFDWMLVRYDLYRYTWHPALLRLAFFVCAFGSLAWLTF